MLFSYIYVLMLSSYIYNPLLFPLTLLLLPPCSFSLYFLIESFLKTSSFDFAKREGGYISTEARNLWKADCPGGSPSAKQKHKKAGWAGDEYTLEEGSVGMTKNCRFFLAPELTFLSPSYVSFSIPLESFKLFQAHTYLICHPHCLLE